MFMIYYKNCNYYIKYFLRKIFNFLYIYIYFFNKKIDFYYINHIYNINLIIKVNYSFYIILIFLKLD